MGKNQLIIHHIGEWPQNPDKADMFNSSSREKIVERREGRLLAPI